MNFAGVQIGHATNIDYHTGCTVFLCPENTVGSVDVRGPAPGSREVALLALDKPNRYVNAVMLSGGSAFGLATADGAMRYLAEKGIGHHTPIRPVPIVPTAIVYDFFLGQGELTPDAEMGYAACLAAGQSAGSSGEGVPQGNVGAGAGVTVGKWTGPQGMMKGGFGMASVEVDELVVSAAAVVNAVGDVVGADGRVLAGARAPDGGWAADDNVYRRYPNLEEIAFGTNTTLVVIVTNAPLNRVGCNRLAQRGHDGLALAIRPAHTTHDGDTVFALATGQAAVPMGDGVGPAAGPFDFIGNVAVEVVAEAIRNAVRHAATVGDVPGLAS